MKLVEVTVTDDHIKRGHRGQPMSCPIARALRDKYGPLSNPYVEDVSATVRIGDQDHHLELSARARRFVSDFDTRRPVQPQTFRLPIANPYR
jgi:hypothetical protein